MPRFSTVIRTADGGTIIACGSRRAPKKCSVCKTAPGTQLCDGPGQSPNDTCDTPLCKRCSTSPRTNVDLCPKHSKPEALR